MGKRGTFFTVFMFFLLALIPSVFSISGDLEFSGTVNDGDKVEIAGKTFEFRIDSVSSKVLVEIDASGVIVNNGECKLRDRFNICVQDISFSYKNLTTYRYVYKALIEVYRLKSTIKATISIEKDEILIDEETIVELSIENTADISAEDVMATINLPSSILVTDVIGCKLVSGNVVFKDNVHPTQIRKCTYKIRGLTADDFELKANISYNDGTEIKSLSSNGVDVKVYNYSLKISSNENKTSFNIGEKINLTIKVENINGEYDLDVTTLSIKIPEKLLLLKRPPNTRGTRKIISWSGSLGPEENKEFLLQLQGLVTKNYTVSTEASYKINKFLRKTKEDVNIEVKCDCPYIKHEFSNEIVVPEQGSVLLANIINPSSANSFSNVKLDFVTNVPGIEEYSKVYNTIRPGEIIKIFDSSIIGPSLGQFYYFNITASYESANNQVFVVKDNIIIKIPEEEKIKEIIEEGPEGEIEEEKTEEVALETKKPEELIEEEEKEIQEEELRITIIDEEKEPIKAYAILGFIAALFFILVLVFTFRRKKGIKIRGKTLEDIEKSIDEMSKDDK